MTDIESLWHWRREIADLYATIRRTDDPPAAHAMWCAKRRALFAAHPQSPIDLAERGGYHGPHVFPYNPALRFLARLAPLVGAPPEQLDAGADGTVGLEPFARTLGLRDALGGELTLYWIGGYGGGVFLPFADATNGRETYGAGRYVLDTIKSADLGVLADGRVVLDFNFAYFPSCAYSPRWTCPLAPPANRLPSALTAGERLQG